MTEYFRSVITVECLIILWDQATPLIVIASQIHSLVSFPVFKLANFRYENTFLDLSVHVSVAGVSC